MSTSQDYTLPQAAQHTRIAYATLRRWVNEGLVPSHTKTNGTLRRLSQSTVTELKTLHEAHSVRQVQRILRRRQLGTLSTKEAAARIGVSDEQLGIWARNGRIRGLIKQDGAYHFPIAVVDRLTEINHDFNLDEAGTTLGVGPSDIKHLSAKTLIRHRTFPNGIDHYDRTDIAFWRDQMSEPGQREAVLKLIRTPVAIIDELTELSKAAQRLIERTDPNLLQTALAFRRRLLSDQPPS